MWVRLFPSSQVRLESGRVENSTGRDEGAVGLAGLSRSGTRPRSRSGVSVSRGTAERRRGCGSQSASQLINPMRGSALVQIADSRFRFAGVVQETVSGWRTGVVETSTHGRLNLLQVGVPYRTAPFRVHETNQAQGISLVLIGPSGLAVSVRRSFEPTPPQPPWVGSSS